MGFTQLRAGERRRSPACGALLDHLAALGLALLLARGRDHALALALVHAAAGVTRAGALALALALVDAGAADLGVLLLALGRGVGERRARGEHRCDAERDQRSLGGAVHDVLLRSPG